MTEEKQGLVAKKKAKKSFAYANPCGLSIPIQHHIKIYIFHLISVLYKLLNTLSNFSIATKKNSNEQFLFLSFI